LRIPLRRTVIGLVVRSFLHEQRHGMRQKWAAMARRLVNNLKP